MGMPTTPTQPVSVVYSQFKGKPMITFKESENERFPFTFGPAKARKLIAYIEQNGPEKFMEVLQEVIKNAPKESEGD